jgi:transposase
MRMPDQTDLTDAQWKIVKGLIPPAQPGGRPREVNLREVLTTRLDQARTGGQWELLPHDLLPKSTVWDYFAQGRDDGPGPRIVDALRTKVRVAEGRDPTPRVGSSPCLGSRTLARRPARAKTPCFTLFLTAEPPPGLKSVVTTRSIFS